MNFEPASSIAVDAGLGLEGRAGRVTMNEQSPCARGAVPNRVGLSTRLPTGLRGPGGEPGICSNDEKQFPCQTRNARMPVMVKFGPQNTAEGGCATSNYANTRMPPACRLKGPLRCPRCVKIRIGAEESALVG